MTGWFTEKHTSDSGLTFKIKETLYSHKSRWQKIDVVETEAFGRVLLLDDLVMLTERDEFVYHEMMAHVPLCSHSCPEDVLIVGGGDGGTAREVLRHDRVKSVTLVEIDEEVIECCRRFFPEVSSELNGGSSVTINIEDGFEFVRNRSDSFDVILVDSTDPIGPCKKLFSREFYQSIQKALRDDGILVAQSESPFLHGDIQEQMIADLCSIFPIVLMYLVYIPTYPTGMWSFLLASKKFHPIENLQPNISNLISAKTRYYNPRIHESSFALPNFIEKAFER